MKVVLRVLTAVIGISLALGHWLLVGYPIQSIAQPEARVLEASVEPLPLAIHCPGAFVQLGGQEGTDLGVVERLGEAELFLQRSTTELLQTPEPTTTTFASAKVSGNNQDTSLMSMLQSQAIDQTRAVGLQASYCPQALATGWLVNGSAVAGVESVLIAANPSEVEALVELEIHLPNRMVTDTFALAPLEEQLISMARYANAEEFFTVNFKTNGPEVLMAMQNRETRGLTPTGVEIELPVVEASQQMTFVGLRELTGGFALPLLRVYNPSDEQTEVVVSALDGSNVELFRLLVPGSSFGSLELPLSDSFQLITLESEQPVIAAIKSFNLEPILDFAWLLPAERFLNLSLPIPDQRPALVLSNPNASPVEITVEISSGSGSSVQSFVISALGTQVITTQGQSLRVTGSAEFVAALEILDASGYSIIRPTENQNLGEDLQIRID